MFRDYTSAERGKVCVTLRHEADTLVILSRRQAVLHLRGAEVSVPSGDNSHNFPIVILLLFSSNHVAANHSNALNAAILYSPFSRLC